MIEEAKRIRKVKEYYFSQKLKEVRALQDAGNAILNMGIGSPDLAPPKAVKEALIASMETPFAHQYQSYQGIPELRNAMAAFYARQYNVALDPTSEVMPLMGSKEGILHISMAFLNPGDTVLIPNPGYPTYTSVTELVGAKPLYYDLKETNHYAPDMEALEAMDLSKVKLMWINAPHMPTGTVYSRETLRQLVLFAQRHNILLVNDNPYSLILNTSPSSLLEIEGAKDVAMELNSLSKSFNMAGWRVGMLVGKATFLQSVIKVKTNMDSGMFYGVQKGAVAALETSNEWLDNLNQRYSERRELVWEFLDVLGCSYHRNSAGLFVWAKISGNSVSSSQFVDKLLHEKHIFIAPGTIFGSNGEGYVRISLCVDEKEIQEAIKRVKATVNNDKKRANSPIVC